MNDDHVCKKYLLFRKILWKHSAYSMQAQPTANSFQQILLMLNMAGKKVKEQDDFIEIGRWEQLPSNIFVWNYIA